MAETRICSVDGCDNQVVARGWCENHYRRWRRYGDPEYPMLRERCDGPCLVDGCENPSVTKGLCNAHYIRSRKFGDPILGGNTPGFARDFIESIAIPFSGDECLEWPFATDQFGYGMVADKGKPSRAHRVVCEAVNGKPASQKLHAAHICGNRACVNPRHIRWATARENALDKFCHGTDTRGERNNKARLTERDVLEIRRDYKTVRSTDLAKRYGVAESTISEAAKGRTWRWLL